jgi:hypothetical protein
MLISTVIVYTELQRRYASERTSGWHDLTTSKKTASTQQQSKGSVKDIGKKRHPKMLHDREARPA